MLQFHYAALCSSRAYHWLLLERFCVSLCMSFVYAISLLIETHEERKVTGFELQGVLVRHIGSNI